MGPSNKPTMPLPAASAVSAGATAASTTSNLAATDTAPFTAMLAPLTTLLQSKDVQSIEAFLNTISRTPEGALLGLLWNSAMDEGLRMGSVKLEERFEDGQKIGYHEGYNAGFDEGSRSGIEQGKAEGLEEGRQSGVEEGQVEGRRTGMYEGRQLSKESAQHNDADAVVQVSLPTVPIAPSNIMCDSGTQTSGDSQTFGKLISYRQARRTRGSLLYGFPLDEKGSMQCGEKLLPIDPELTGQERRRAMLRQFPLISEHVRTICDPVWPMDRTEVGLGWTGRQQHTLLVLVACTRRNDELIPQGEVLQQLKDIMMNEGYEKEPGWFVVLR